MSLVTFARPVDYFCRPGKPYKGKGSGFHSNIQYGQVVPDLLKFCLPFESTLLQHARHLVCYMMF